MNETAAQYRKRVENLVRERRPVDLKYVSFEVALANLTEAGEGLTDVEVEVETDHYYDSCTASVTVSGYRPKTEKELAAEQTQIELNKENARKSKEQAKKGEWTLAQNLYKKYKKDLEKLDS